MKQTENPTGQVFYDVFRSCPIGIVLEDIEGKPLFVNPAFCAMLGFSEEELLTKHCVDFSPAEDAEKDWALFQQLRAGSITHYHLDKRYFRRDGSLVWGRLSISMLNDRLPPLVIAMVEDITEKMMAQEAERKAEAVVSNFSQKLIQAQEAERASVARELHDDINQRVALTILNLEGLISDPSLPTKARSEIDSVVAQLCELSADVQALSYRLHSARLEHLGLDKAAASFCREVSTKHKVRIEFQSKDISNNLSNEVSLCLFRVMQEAVQNATKHSGSTHVRVSLSAGSDEIELTVSDSGKGFDPQEALHAKGMGLASMRERLKLVDGQLSIKTERARGTTIQARVPFRAMSRSAASKLS